MHEGSEAPEEGEGPKEDDLEEFRKHVMEKGAEGVDEETLEDWREGIADKEDGAREEKEAGDKEGTAEGGKPEKETADADGAQEQGEESKVGSEKDDAATVGGEDRGDSAEQEKTTEVPADAAEAKENDSANEAPDNGTREAPTEDKSPEEGGAASASEKPTEHEQDEKSLPTDNVSYSRNDDQMLVVEHASSGSERDEQSETPGLHHLQSHQDAVESRTFEAVDYGRGANVRFPQGDLEQAGFDPPEHSTIVQLGLKPEGSEDVETVFARYSASDHRAEAYVGDIGGQKGSRYELVEAKEVTEDALTRAFERGKCEHLENVKLEHQDGKVYMNVDGRGVELSDYKMATSGSHLVVRGKLEGEDSCKLEFDGRRASVKFGRDYPVEGMKLEKDELVVKYEQSRNEVHEHRLHLEHLAAPERPSLNQFDKPQMLEHIQALNRPPGSDGMYQIALDEPARREVEGLLADAPDYGLMKAEISERLVPNILESLGWERIERHPFSRSRKDSAAANGVDWLMRDLDGDTALVEIKWLEDRRNGIRKAAAQVERDFRDCGEDSGFDIKAAYIAIVDYDEENRENKPMKVHVLRVADKEGLR